MYGPRPPELLNAAATVLLAIAAEDGNVDRREIETAAGSLAGWGRVDRVTAAGAVERAFQELGRVWSLGGEVEFERHVWFEAGNLVDRLGWEDLQALGKELERVAAADGKIERAEAGLVEALTSYFDRESAPPEDLPAVELLRRFDADSRGEAWVSRLYATLPGTLFEIGVPGNLQAYDPRTFEAPDGFGYAEARLTVRGGRESRFDEIARFCTNAGVGLAIEPEWTDPPGWVLSYGYLWAWRAWGAFDASPNHEWLPRWAREVLAATFERYGLPGRQHAAVMDARGLPAIAFDAPPSFVPDARVYDALQRTLTWMSPPSLSLIAVDPRQVELPWEPL